MSAFSRRSIVVAYEDNYCDKLHLLLKALRRDLGLPGLCLEPRSVHGTGGFINEVPKILRTPLKQTKCPPDRVVCVGDADRPRNLTPEAPLVPPGADPTDLDRWVIELEKNWRKTLIQDAHLSPEAADKLTVVCLRWNKESLLLASPEALLEYAQKLERREEVAAVLEACRPCPTIAQDGDFVASYRRPDACMDLVIAKIASRHYKKGRDDDDLLEHHITPDPTRRSQLLRRCPDLERVLAALV